MSMRAKASICARRPPHHAPWCIREANEFPKFLLAAAAASEGGLSSQGPSACGRHAPSKPPHHKPSPVTTPPRGVCRVLGHLRLDAPLVPRLVLREHGCRLGLRRRPHVGVVEQLLDAQHDGLDAHAGVPVAIVGEEREADLPGRVDVGVGKLGREALVLSRCGVCFEVVGCKLWLGVCRGCATIAAHQRPRPPPPRTTTSSSATAPAPVKQRLTSIAAARRGSRAQT